MWAVTGIRREFAGHPPSRHQGNPLNDVTLFPPPLACASQDRQTPLCPRPSPPRTMSEDHASRQRKASRSAITNPAPAKQLVRARPGSPSQETQDDTRPAKRTRKAINCEPCRGSKLKCDRSVRVRIRRCGCLFIFFFIGIGPALPVSSAVSQSVLWDSRPRLTIPWTDFCCRDGRVMLSRCRWTAPPPR